MPLAPQFDFLAFSTVVSAFSSARPATASNQWLSEDPRPVTPAKTTIATNAPIIAYSRRSCPSVVRSQRNLGTKGSRKECSYG